MIWLALAVMAAVCWWNNNRYSWYLDNVVASVDKKLTKFRSELDDVNKVTERVTVLESNVRVVREDVEIMAGHLEKLLDEPTLRAREVSQAALDYLMRRGK